MQQAEGEAMLLDPPGSGCNRFNQVDPDLLLALRRKRRLTGRRDFCQIVSVVADFLISFSVRRSAAQLQRYSSRSAFCLRSIFRSSGPSSGSTTSSRLLGMPASLSSLAAAP